ncbi:MAG: low molecular weight phosphotyrosine protein phosphatase [Synergistaceae bacterium]|nr:low molecular weight phosphotyrosine protein phosphatase [Synergistaceae bacterium]MBR0168638.1 low molecular weight phosphotyrosine protein phosphatase [Synergistaceae bacterium]
MNSKGSERTIRILFVCHGNICRSPMAEFIMKHLISRAGLSEQFTISSAATTTKELGNDIYPNAKAELKRRGIPFEKRRARQIRSDEYAGWDLIIAMDRENLAGIERIVGDDPEHKVWLLLSFAGEEKSVSDPWFTRNFARAYDDILRGCEGLLGSLLGE